MKHVGIVAIGIILSFAASIAASGNRSSSGVGKVLVNVEPNVKVDIAENPLPVHHQTGDVSVTLTFQVDANQQTLAMFVEASDLYKGDDPSGASVGPIPLNRAVPVVIEPDHANPVNGASNQAPWTGAGSPIGAFATARSAVILFESSQNNRFSQNVDVTLSWTQNDPEKAQGQYGGRVRLTAVLQP